MAERSWEVIRSRSSVVHSEQEGEEAGESQGIEVSDSEELQQRHTEDNSSVKIPELPESESSKLNEFPSQRSILRTGSSKVARANFVSTPNDTNDPSYTNLTLPYSVVCRQRYRAAGIKQKAQLKKELKCHELLQNKALDGVRIHREFGNAILIHPKPEKLIKLTERQKVKIEEILARNY